MKRIIGLIVCMITFPLFIDRILESNWFGNYDKLVCSTGVLVAAVIFYKFGPSIEEFREFQRRKRQ
jgi:hypothetical protein